MYGNRFLIEDSFVAQILYDHVQYDKKGKNNQNIMFVIGMRSTCMILLSLSMSQLKGEAILQILPLIIHRGWILHHVSRFSGCN